MAEVRPARFWGLKCPAPRSRPQPAGLNRTRRVLARRNRVIAPDGGGRAGAGVANFGSGSTTEATP